MGLDDKAKHAAQEAAGKVKEAVGKATHDDELTAEGRAEQVKAHLHQVGDDVKQTGDDVKDAFDK